MLPSLRKSPSVQQLTLVNRKESNEVFIIQDGVKRSLDTSKPYHIAMSMADAEKLVEQLGFAIEQGGWWVSSDINPKIKIDHALDAAAPLKWTDPGNVNRSVEEMRQRAIDPGFIVGPALAGFSAGFAGGEFAEDEGELQVDEANGGNPPSGVD